MTCPTGGAYDRDPTDNPNPVTRVVQYWYRTFTALGHGADFVLDRVKSLPATGAAHARELRWHLPPTNAPVVSGNVISSVNGSSKVYIAPLNLTNPDVSASARDIATSDGVPNTTYIGKVNDTTSATDLNVVTLLYATSSGAPCQRPRCLRHLRMPWPLSWPTRRRRCSHMR